MNPDRPTFEDLTPDELDALSFVFEAVGRAECKSPTEFVFAAEDYEDLVAAFERLHRLSSMEKDPLDFVFEWPRGPGKVQDPAIQLAALQELDLAVLQGGRRQEGDPEPRGLLGCEGKDGPQ